MTEYRDRHSATTEKFLHELFLLYERYQRTIGHEDGQGAFIIQSYTNEEDINVNWMRDAFEDLNLPQLSVEPLINIKKLQHNLQKVLDRNIQLRNLLLQSYRDPQDGQDGLVPWYPADITRALARLDSSGVEAEYIRLCKEQGVNPEGD